MLTIQELKNKIESLGHQVNMEMTSGNYDKDNKLINVPIPTLSTKYCEIGFYNEEVYLVFIIVSKSWSERLYKTFLQIPNLEIYSFKDFHNNYELSDKMESKIKSELYFQIQLNYNVNKCNADEILNLYEKTIHDLLDSGAEIVDQFELIMTK